MDRPLSPWLCLSLALLTTPTFADEPAGAAEYKAALETSTQLVTLMQEMLEVTDDAKQLPESVKAQKREQLMAYTASYPQQLKASADLGFPPAQYVYAQTLKLQAITTPAQREPLKSQACELLNQAASSGLMMATLGKTQYCPSLTEARDAATALKTSKDAYALLAATLDRPDPYAAYYPLKAPRLAECWEQQTDPFDSSLTPLERLQASQPPALTMDETRAEIFYQLAMHERGGQKALAKQHVAQAEALGCSSRAFVSFQKYLNKNPSH